MKRFAQYIALAVVVLSIAACSTSNNTASSRFYHAFTARYNTYFNGHEAYKTACLAQEKGHSDNYTEMLPVFIVSNKATATIGKGDFSTAIKKCEKVIKNHSIKRKPNMSTTRRRTEKQKRILAKREYNPFLKNAWMLMGMSQFHQGDFVEAASTFSYITRLYAAEPDVLAESRAWLATCYDELGWLYDAEDIYTNKIGRDSLPHSALKDLDISYADYYVRHEKFQEALPYLRKVVKHEKRSFNKARLYFLMGQIYNSLGDKKNAYKSLSHVISLSPPYEMSFNARVLQTEVLSKGQSKKMLSRLKSMARSSKNTKYLDQVYYAMGNIYLTEKDTVKAIEAYENGNNKAVVSTPAKGVLLLKLGELYYLREDFTSARRCYDKALGLVNKERKDYKDIQTFTKTLDELEPHTAAVHLQDSLKALVAMPEAERFAAIDKIIAVEKEKERKARKEAALKGLKANAGSMAALASKNQQAAAAAGSTAGSGSGKWYFYNEQAVAQGKETFKKQWGDRTLEDNWRRSNKAASTTSAPSDNASPENAADSLKNKKGAATDSTKTAKNGKNAGDNKEGDKTAEKSDKNEKLTREYYIKQLPVTDEQIAKSDETTMKELFASGVIEKDKLENLPLAEKTFQRLYTEYPSFKEMNELLYQMFLLESRMGNTAKADQYKEALETNYAQDKYTALITNPNFITDAKFGKQLEDSLYTVTYDAYRKGDVNAIISHAQISATRFPEGENRPKFMFFDALAQLQTGKREVFLNELDSLTKNYPKDDLTPIATMIIKGVKSGRVPGSGLYDVGSLWSRRSAGDRAAADSLAMKNMLSKERNTDFTVIIAYPTDSVNENQLLYDVAHYNFTNFSVRNFEIQQSEDQGLGELRVVGFHNFDEAHTYAQNVYLEKEMKPHFKHAHLIVISNANLEKLGVDYSISDYEKFYSENFAPIKVKPDLQLDKQTDIYISEDELPSEQTDENKQEENNNDNGTDDNTNQNNGNDNDWYPAE